jgi:hypothetical protein
VTRSGAREFTHARLPSRAFRNRTLRGARSMCRHLEEVNDGLEAALRLGTRHHVGSSEVADEADKRVSEQGLRRRQGNRS